MSWPGSPAAWHEAIEGLAGQEQTNDLAADEARSQHAREKRSSSTFYTTWCKPCKKFATEVLPRKDVRLALGDVIFQKYDAERGNGLKAALPYGVRNFPTFLAIDGTGKARARRRGGIPAAAFISFVQRARIAVVDAHGVQKLLAMLMLLPGEVWINPPEDKTRSEIELQ